MNARNKKSFDLISSEQTTSDELEILLGLGKLLDREISQHPNASFGLLDKLILSTDKLTRRFAAVHPNFRPDSLAHLAWISAGDLVCTFALPKMTDDQIHELLHSIGQVKFKRLIKLEDCPVNVLMWVLKSGTDEMRLIVAKRKYLPDMVRDGLISAGGLIAAKAAVERNYIVSKQGEIVGNYQKHTVISKFEFIFESSDWQLDAVVAKHRQRLQSTTAKQSLPDLWLSHVEIIESIEIHADQIFENYLLITNLPNLRRIRVLGSPARTNTALKWMVCKNLPSLEEVEITGNLRWLDLDQVDGLKSVHIKNCHKLSHLGIYKANSMVNLDLINCILLREVDGLTASQIEQFQIQDKINTIQSASSRKLKIKYPMTFSDIDYVFDIINRGLKCAVEKGIFQKSSGVDLCYGRECDPKFSPFSYRSLFPLEQTYTGGTGEIYFYEQRCHNFVNGSYGIWDYRGCSEPQECLQESLRTIIALTESKLTPLQLLKWLDQLISQG